VCWRPWLPFWGYRLQRFKQSDVAVAAERNVPGAEAVVFADVLRDADRLSLPRDHALARRAGVQ
jgi:hypothetical protein